MTLSKKLQRRKERQYHARLLLINSLLPLTTITMNGTKRTAVCSFDYSKKKPGVLVSSVLTSCEGGGNELLIVIPARELKIQPGVSYLCNLVPMRERQGYICIGAEATSYKMEINTYPHYLSVTTNYSPDEWMFYVIRSAQDVEKEVRELSEGVVEHLDSHTQTIVEAFVAKQKEYAKMIKSGNIPPEVVEWCEALTEELENEFH